MLAVSLWLRVLTEALSLVNRVTHLRAWASYERNCEWLAPVLILEITLWRQMLKRHMSQSVSVIVDAYLGDSGKKSSPANWSTAGTAATPSIHLKSCRHMCSGLLDLL